MTRRIIALTLGMLICFGMFTSACAETATYEIAQDIVSGYSITTPTVNVTAQEGFSISFSAKNTLSETADISVSVKAFMGTELLAGSAITGRLASNKSVPVTLKSTEAVSGHIVFDITVVNPSRLTTYYVSPTGNDSNQGTESKPLATVNGVVSKLSSMDADLYEDEDITFIFKEGHYSVNSAVNLNDEVAKNTKSITLKAEDGADVEFVGGLEITGKDFYEVTDSAVLANFRSDVHGKVYALNLADYGLSFDFSNAANADPMLTTLYYNDASQQIARYPNSEKLESDSTYISGRNTEQHAYLIKNYEVTDAELDANVKAAWQQADISETWVNGWLFYQWEQTKGRLGAVTESGITAYMPTSARDTGDTSPGKGTYYIYNMPYEIDTVGEYAILDNVLYYYPSEADVASGAFLNASFKLNTDSNRMLSITTDNVSVENIAFNNSKGDFIYAKANNIKILGCEFYNNASRAVAVSGNNNLVSACDFHDLGGAGISIGGGDKTTLTPSGSVLENCLFTNNGLIDRTGAAAFSLSGVGVTARRNTISGVPHSAISYSGNNHIIEYNDISNALTDGASDAGIIYTGRNLSNLGTIIRYNYLHDSNSGMGSIYWDDRLSGQRAIGNVFENVKRALFIHAGICNTFNDNIVIKKEGSTTDAVRFRGRTYNVENDGSEYTDSNGNKYNLWFTQPFIDVKYSHTYNTFMAHLVGSTAEALGSGYPGVPWENEYWQNAYSVGSATDTDINTDENYKHVLNYVNYKTTRKIEETVIKNNFFAGYEAASIGCNLSSGNDYINPQTEIVNTNNTYGELTGEKLTQYNSVVNNSGIYVDSYRTSIN